MDKPLLLSAVCFLISITVFCNIIMCKKNSARIEKRIIELERQLSYYEDRGFLSQNNKTNALTKSVKESE